MTFSLRIYNKLLEETIRELAQKKPDGENIVKKCASYDPYFSINKSGGRNQ